MSPINSRILSVAEMFLANIDTVVVAIMPRMYNGFNDDFWSMPDVKDSRYCDHSETVCSECVSGWTNQYFVSVMGEGTVVML